jgi:imidazolonepropionase
LKLLIKNIKQLIQIRPTSTILVKEALDELPIIENAFLLCDNGLIEDYGSMDDCMYNYENVIDAQDCIVMPTWIDSHTHSVFANYREGEFEQRIKGATYQEIADNGGGILNSANNLEKKSEDELFNDAFARVKEAIIMGTGALEIKSGYGLTVDAELKMLRVIKRLKATFPIPIKTTFLGAHTFPQFYKNNRKGYIDLIINEMLPQIAEQDLADYIDVFCEKNYFQIEETDRILEAAVKYGLKPKIHTNQFFSMGGIEIALKHKALSVDHLEVLTDEEIELLAKSETIATLLPSAPFFLNDANVPPARKMINAGVKINLASDFNPGTSPSNNMQFVVSLACIKLRMTPSEAINAATYNAAFALELQDEVGSISKGKIANLIITKKIPNYKYIPYAFGNVIADKVIINGIVMK